MQHGHPCTREEKATLQARLDFARVQERTLEQTLLDTFMRPSEHQDAKLEETEKLLAATREEIKTLKRALS